MLEIRLDPALEKTLGHYQLVRQIGGDTISTLYEAVDTRLRRRVALKVVSVPARLSFTQRRDLLTRLKREGRAVGSLSHPNIVTIHDVGEQGNHHFLVMEFLEGKTLRDRLNSGTLWLVEASQVLDQIAAGLDALHAHDIVHRDLQPGNILLLPDGQVKLINFGGARQADDTIVTQAGDIVGAPAFMSPEQIQGDTVTPVSDVWSLGALLYAMLSGQSPFAGGSVADVLQQVTSKKQPALPRSPAPVQKVILRALERDPARRYRTASDLAAAFRAVVAPDSKPSAGPVSGEEKLQRELNIAFRGAETNWVATVTKYAPGPAEPAPAGPALAQPAPATPEAIGPKGPWPADGGADPNRLKRLLRHPVALAAALLLLILILLPHLHRAQATRIGVTKPAARAAERSLTAAVPTLAALADSTPASAAALHRGSLDAQARYLHVRHFGWQRKRHGARPAGHA